MVEALLQVSELSVWRVPAQGAAIHAVRGVNFEMGPGEGVGMLGESGSGKTTAALSLLRLLPAERTRIAGSARFQGNEIFALPESELQNIRGAKISLVHQDPSLALNPVRRVGEQVADVLQSHGHGSRAECRRKAEAMLELVLPENTRRIYSSYPHELSGGQRQRLVIAQALACGPALLVADEPTGALDATVQADILSLLRDLKSRWGVALLLITHNPAILPGLVERILVMYAGQIVEEGSTEQVLRAPLHPYTAGLLGCLPTLAVAPPREAKSPLSVIPGSSPDLSQPWPGCAFEPRCPVRMEVCTVRQPPPVEPAAKHGVKCFKYGGAN